MNVENDKERDLLVNRIYTATLFLESDIRNILKNDKPKGKELTEAMNKLNDDLEAVTYFYQDGGIVGGDKFEIHYDKGDLNWFNGASITINDKKFDIKAFDEDKKLSVQELEYLSYLDKKVNKFKSSLEPKVRKNPVEEKESMSFEELNEISNQFFKEEYQVEKLSK